MSDMPLYEYRRTDGTRFEIVQHIDEPALKRCPTTRQKVTRVMHAPTIIYRGAGFYSTDYGKARQGRSATARVGDQAVS